MGYSPGPMIRIPPPPRGGSSSQPAPIADAATAQAFTSFAREVVANMDTLLSSPACKTLHARLEAAKELDAFCEGRDYQFKPL